MPINSETLKALRERQGLSQQGLADLAAQSRNGSVSKRTIARIESGEIFAEKVRARTVESLAKALKVAPDDLCKPITEIRKTDWKKLGYTSVQVMIQEDVRTNYRWVGHHYGVGFQYLVDAAPWMFTLLAEMSLADRRRRRVEAEAAFDHAMQVLPRHLGHGHVAQSRFDTAMDDEIGSLGARDIFGNKVLQTDSFCDPFDPDSTNPFLMFLCKLVEEIDSDAIDPEDIDLSNGARMPHWPVFQSWLHTLTGGDSWALFAVENVKGILKDLPPELKGEEQTAARVAWLVGRIPPEMREREEQRRAKDAADFDDLGIKL